MSRQSSMHSFFSKSSSQSKQTGNPTTDNNINAHAQISYSDMLNRQQEKQLQFSQFQHKFAIPKKAAPSSIVKGGSYSDLTQSTAIQTPEGKTERTLFTGNLFTSENSPLQNTPFRTPLQSFHNGGGSHSDLRQSTAIKTPAEKTERTLVTGNLFTSENSLLQNTPFRTSQQSFYNGSCASVQRQNVPTADGISFIERLNSVQNDAAVDRSVPETPAMRPFVPRIKRIHEEDVDVTRCQNLLPGSDPNKRRRLINALGEDGLEQGGAWEKAKSKFEFLDPSVIRDAKLRRPDDPLYDKRTLRIPKDVLNNMSASQKQYWTTKCQYMDTILFFKVGKFYELYEVDAEIGQKEFDWKMTISGVGKCRQVGVPEGGIEDAIQKLVERGYKVGRMEQLETLEQAKAKRGSTATVQRELVHISTPSTPIDGNIKADAVHLLALKEESFGRLNNNSVAYGFAFVDAAACQVFVGSLSDDSSCSALIALLMQVSPREILYEIGGISKETQKALKKYSSLGSMPFELTGLQPGSDFMDFHSVYEFIQSKGYFKGPGNTSCFAVFDRTTHKEFATSALGALVLHLHRMKLDGDLLKNGVVSPYEVYEGSLRLDGQTLANLEIFNNNADGSEAGTLFKHLDNCTTSFGKRLLRRWICRPLRNIQEVNHRLDAIEEFMARPEIVSCVSKRLHEIPDLERLVARVNGSSGSLAVGLGPLFAMKKIKQRVKTLWTAVKGLQVAVDLLKVLIIGDEKGPPKSHLLLEASQMRDLNELDKLLNQLELMMQEKFSFDMKSEKKDKDLGGDEVESLNSIEILFSQEKAHWSRIVDAISYIDVLLALAMYSNSSNAPKCRPVLVPFHGAGSSSEGEKEGSFLSIKGLWHPYAVGGRGGMSVPNDVELGNDGAHDFPRAMLLTGPNMGGKSTLLRATCLAVIMAQLGCYVPCESCILSPADVIFTRLGASDRIISGDSTFLVECLEAASVLQYATEHSLVVLDELGRGTSTFDGYAIAYAVFRHLVEKKDCRLLFATHYHPLTKEFASHPRVSLRHMSYSFETKSTFADNMGVSNFDSKKTTDTSDCLSLDSFETKKQLVFLYKLQSGASPESYGLQVALLAGMPRSLVKGAYDASQVMKSWLSSSFESSEQRAEFSTLHEQWLRTLLSTTDNKSLQNSVEFTFEDVYDTLLCVWHELRKYLKPY